MTAETLGSHGDHSVVVTAVVACDKKIDARVPALAVTVKVYMILITKISHW